jgi:hypothetical protein
MAQISNPAGHIGRAPAHLSRSLFATGAIATVLLIALVLSFQVLAPQTHAPAVGPQAAKPPVSAPYDGRLDPIEWNYIRQAHNLHPLVAAPQRPTSEPRAPYVPNGRGTQQQMKLE